MMYGNIVREHLCKSIETKQALLLQYDEITKIGNLITECLQRGNIIFLFGNGGSAADAQHIAAEFTGRFKRERIGLPAIALTTDSSALTAIANDYGFDSVFDRQLSALAREGDIAIGISTSGNSKNVIRAFETAHKIGVITVSLTGGNGGVLSDTGMYSIVVPSSVTAHIQECHITIGHIWCEIIDQWDKVRNQ